jgi:hypothetical protein
MPSADNAEIAAIRSKRKLINVILAKSGDPYYLRSETDMERSHCTMGPRFREDDVDEFTITSNVCDLAAKPPPIGGEHGDEAFDIDEPG